VRVPRYISVDPETAQKLTALPLLLLVAVVFPVMVMPDVVVTFVNVTPVTLLIAAMMNFSGS
jgi:hypothetical protein